MSLAVFRVHYSHRIRFIINVKTMHLFFYCLPISSVLFFLVFVALEINVGVCIKYHTVNVVA